MSVFDNHDKDDLEYEIRSFLENNTITELLDVVHYCIRTKEDEYIDELVEYKLKNKIEEA